MSFGVTGGIQTQQIPLRVEQSPNLLSEQSEDFYQNTGRSHFTKMSSQASVEVRGGDFNAIPVGY